MPRFRCHNEDCTEDPYGRLMFDFEVAAGKPGICPKCGADPRLPEFKQMITPLVDVHWLVKDKAGPIIEKGRWKVACDPALKIGKIMLAKDPVCVTCPACKKAPGFPADLSPTVPPEADLEVEIDTHKQVITRADKPCGGCK